MTSYWAQKLKARTSRNFIGRIQEIEFFDTLLTAPEPEYLIVHVFGVGGVGKTTLLDRFESTAKEQGILVGRVNEAGRSIPTILEKFHQDIRKQEKNLDNFSRIFNSFSKLQQELRHDPEFTIALLESSGRVYSTQKNAQQRLRQKIDELQQRWDTISRKLSDLEQDKIRETRPDEKFRIEHLIDELDAERRHIEQQLSNLESQVFAESNISGDEAVDRGADNILQIRTNHNTTTSAVSQETPKNLKIPLRKVDDPEGGLQFMEHLYRKIADPQSRELLLNAEYVLTQAFVQDIMQITQSQRVLLIFDTWEFLSSFADEWLREEFLSQNLDQIGPKITIALAGREQLSGKWEPYLEITRQVPLKPFSPQETEDFLINRGISDPATIRTIQDLSGNLPLMLSLLSDKTTAVANELSATRDVTERFLKWIPQQESIKREAIIACAIPRFFDESIISTLVPEGSAQELFSWLCSFSFTTSDIQTKHWRYHSIVRRLMMQYLFDRNPEQHQELHNRMADYYETRLGKSDFPDDEKHQSKHWQNLQLECLYHKLCQNQGFDMFVRLFLQAFRRSAYAQELVNTFIVAQEDLRERSDYYEWYTIFQEAPQCRDAAGCSLPDWTSVFQRFAEYPGLTDLSLRAFVHYELGYFYTIQKQYNLAEQACRQAIDFQPDYVSPYNSLGTVYRLTGRLEEAEKLHRQCIELAPNYIFPYYNLGRVLHKMGRDDEAEIFYRKSIELRPNLPFSYFNFANFLREVERYAESVDMYRQAIEMDPEHVNSYINLGAVLEKMGQNIEAERLYRQVIAISPNNYLAYLNLGFLQASTNRSDEAIASFRRCIEIDPIRPDAYIRLARLLESLGREREALSQYRQVAQLVPDNPAVKYLIAELSEKLGRYEEALHWFQEYAKLVPDDPDIVQHIANLQMQKRGKSHEHI